MPAPLRETLNLRFSGLYKNPSTFTQIPPGALSQADNVVIDRENRVDTRRGFDRYGTQFVATGVKSVFSFANNLIAYTQADQLWYDSDSAGTWVAYPGTYDVPDSSQAGNRIRSVESNKNFYFLTSNGTFKLDALTSDPRLAGAPQGLGGTGTTSGTPGFLPDQTNVAYRIVWGYKDMHDNLILGAPSERVIVSNNTGNSANVSVTFQIPTEIDTSWFFQLYRSVPSANLASPPNDELQQTYEANPTAGELIAGEVTVVDTTPDSLLQGFLYTNASQEGILQANYRPPFAHDACFYKNFVFYANTRTVHRLDSTLISAEAPLGLQINDTITFTDLTTAATFTLIGKAVENAAVGEFAISATADPGFDIQQTAISIVRVINNYASNTFLDGYYTSNFDEVPGQMTFEKRNLDALGFYVNSSRSAAFSPTLPAFPATTVQSNNEVSPNRVYYSKEQQPEAVPLLNYLEVGSKNQPIQRIVPLRDGVIVLKQDGVFRISGTDPSNFVVNLLDNTTRIIAPNSPDVLDNQVFFLSDQGVVAASDNSVQIMSRPIEREILRLTAPSLFPNTRELAFGVAYNSDRKYILSLPSTGTDEFCTQQYCYNVITATWTRWTRQTLCGLVFIGDGKLYMGGPNNVTYGGYLFQERKTYTNQDLADEQYTRNITASTATTVTLNSVVSVVVGSQIVQAATSSSAKVLAINGNICTVNVSGLDWTNTSCIVYTPINPEIQTVQIEADNAGAMKQYSEASLVYSETSFDEMIVKFSSDQSASEYIQIYTPQQRGGWGTFNWGTLPWGGVVAGDQQRIRRLVPRNVQRSNWIYMRMSLNQCFATMGLSGVSLGINDMSQRQR